MKITKYYFVSEDEWSTVCRDERYWTDFSKLDKSEWDSFVEICDRVDDRIREISEGNKSIFVIDNVTYFSHRGLECSVDILSKDLIGKLQRLVIDEYPNFQITVSIWDKLEGGKNLGILCITDECTFAMESIEDILVEILGLKKMH